jgi:exodeoxyribonuclease V beta subunit
MAAALYNLQYYIYTVALHKYLESRVPDYAYDTHFGGVFYLFVRGIHPAQPGSGVFYDRPPEGLVAALCKQFGL